MAIITACCIDIGYRSGSQVCQKAGKEASRVYTAWTANPKTIIKHVHVQDKLDSEWSTIVGIVVTLNHIKGGLVVLICLLILISIFTNA